MTVNPWHSADGVKHKNWPVIFFNFFLLSFLFMEGGGTFLLHPGAREIFHQCQNSLSVPHSACLTFQRLPIIGYPFSINDAFLWVSPPCTLWLRLYAEQYLNSYNIYLYILRHVSTDPLSVANNTAAVVRMRSMKPHVKSMKSRIPEGVRSFYERRNWLQLAERFFQVFFCPL